MKIIRFPHFYVSTAIVDGAWVLSIRVSARVSAVEPLSVDAISLRIGEEMLS